MIGHFAGKFELLIRRREEEGYCHALQGYQTCVEIGEFDLCHLKVVLVLTEDASGTGFR